MTMLRTRSVTEANCYYSSPRIIYLLQISDVVIETARNDVTVTRPNFIAKIDMTYGGGGKNGQLANYFA